MHGSMGGGRKPGQSGSHSRTAQAPPAYPTNLWDEALPIEVRELPCDLAALDGLLSDPGLLAPFSAHWQREALASGHSAAGHGRPTIAIETYVRLMVLKQRYGCGGLRLDSSAALLPARVVGAGARRSRRSASSPGGSARTRSTRSSGC